MKHILSLNSNQVTEGMNVDLPLVYNVKDQGVIGTQGTVESSNSGTLYKATEITSQADMQDIVNESYKVSIDGSITVTLTLTNEAKVNLGKKTIESELKTVVPFSKLIIDGVTVNLNEFVWPLGTYEDEEAGETFYEPIISDFSTGIFPDNNFWAHYQLPEAGDDWEPYADEWGFYCTLSAGTHTITMYSKPENTERSVDTYTYKWIDNNDGFIDRTTTVYSLKSALEIQKNLLDELVDSASNGADLNNTTAKSIGIEVKGDYTSIYLDEYPAILSKMASFSIPESISLVNGSAAADLLGNSKFNPSNIGDYYASGVLTANNSSITEINLSDNVREIKDRAFSSLSSLNTVTISKSVLTVSSRAFEHNTNISKIVFNNEMVKLGSGIFNNMMAGDVKPSLEYVELPKGLVVIEGTMFPEDLESLSTIVIPSSIKTIHTISSRHLSRIVFEGTVEQWNNEIEFISGTSINPILSNAGVVLPSSVTEVECKNGKVKIERPELEGED